MLSIVTVCSGFSVAGSPSRLIVSTTSMPSVTRPRTA